MKARFDYRSGLLLSAMMVAALSGPISCSDDDDDPVDPGGDECESANVGPTGEFLYVANSGDGTVSVVNAKECEVVATIQVGDEPSEANATHQGRHVFISNSGSNTVSVIDTQTNAVVSTIPVGARPLHQFFSPEHDKLWIANDDGGSVSVIDVATLSFDQTIPVGSGHKKMAITDGDPYKVYVSNSNDGTISVIETVGMTVEATITVGAGPHGMDYSSLSQKVYNCSGDENPGIDVIRTVGQGANTVEKVIPTPARCNYLHVAPDGRYIWATANDADIVVVIDAMTDEVVGQVPTGDYPDKIRFFNGNRVIVTNVREASVSLIDQNTLQALSEIEVDGLGFWNEQFSFGHRAMHASLDGRHAYIPNSDGNSVSIVDAQTGALLSSIPVGVAPNAMAVGGPAGGIPYPR